MNHSKRSNPPSIFSSIKYLPVCSTSTFLRSFYSMYRFLKQSQTYSKEAIEQYQVKKLQNLIHHAYHYVPYYKSLFTENNIKPSSIQSLSDLTQIPFLTKQQITENLPIMKAINYPLNAFQKRSTGGTTGIPLHFYVERAHWLGIHYAFNTHYMKQAGYFQFDKVISIAGINKMKKYHPFFRTLELSSFHTTSKQLDQYINYINKFKPKFITSFPSALLILTNYHLEHKKNVIIKLKGIFCHGERLDIKQKKFLEEIYNCPVYDQYGQREQCVFATTCKKSDLYHVYPAYGIAEIVDEQQQPVTKNEGKGEIIATSLTNSIFPFIRYKTGDIAVYTKKTCSCGLSHLLLEKIIGRKQEYIVTENNEKIPLTGLYHVIAEHGPYIKECQLYQDTPGKLSIYYVKDEYFKNKYIKSMTIAFQKKLGSNIDITFESVENIKRTKYGKFQYLIQKIPYKKI